VVSKLFNLISFVSKGLVGIADIELAEIFVNSLVAYPQIVLALVSGILETKDALAITVDGILTSFVSNGLVGMAATLEALAVFVGIKDNELALAVFVGINAKELALAKSVNELPDILLEIVASTLFNLTSLVKRGLVGIALTEEALAVFIGINDTLEPLDLLDIVASKLFNLTSLVSNGFVGIAEMLEALAVLVGIRETLEALAIAPK
jgi:hypothetical protein